MTETASMPKAAPLTVPPALCERIQTSFEPSDWQSLLDNPEFVRSLQHAGSPTQQEFLIALGRVLLLKRSAARWRASQSLRY